MKRKRARNQETCTCEAYPYPHRLYGGDCYGHNLIDCPTPLIEVDPYCTRTFNYREVAHGCYKPSARKRKKPNESNHSPSHGMVRNAETSRESYCTI